ncbi:MAG TPA: glycoside hydrolase family 28 protein [Phycisphaerae bacterium]|nr:glycoside hydrolase family 28 protein [Phycisphaerae bacterium]
MRQIICKLFATPALCVAAILAHAALLRAADMLPWPLANQIVAQAKPPVFPDKTFSVLSYGAAGDGKTDNTSAFSAAISACNAAGGGHVVVPAGTYLTGAILLKSNVDLHLEKGAVLMFDGDESEYPLEPTRNQGIDLINFSPLIYANGAANIGITGDGILDGTLTAKWNKQVGANWNRLVQMEKNSVPIAQRIFGPEHPLGTAFVEPYNCTNVLIQGITIQNAHWWQMHPTLSTNVIVDHVTTLSSAAHTDGCDPDGCDNVVIENCDLGAGDDDIAIKSGRDPDTQRVHRPSQNIVVINTQFHGPWGMIACGSEQTEGIAHVFGYNLATDAGGEKWKGVRYVLYLKTSMQRGGYIKDINVDNVTGQFNNAVVFINMSYSGEHESGGSVPPVVTGITLNNVSDKSVPQVLDLVGLENDPIGSITLSNCTFTGIQRTSTIQHVSHLVYQNVTINGSSVQSKPAQE